MYLNRGTSLKQGYLAPTRQSLLSRLKNWEDRESWNAFFSTYWKLIYYTAQKAGLTDAECQDVVQETVISVSRKIPGFKYDPKLGSFKAWLLKLTHWRIRDQFKKRLPCGQGLSLSEEGETDLVDLTVDPQTTWDGEWEKNLFDAALERLKRRVDPKAFQIFDLYVLQNWPPEKVRKFLNVSSARVYVTKHRISTLLKKEMKYLETHYF